MIIQADSGLLDNTTFVASPNCDQRPTGLAVDLIVIHSISLPPGEFGGPWIDQLFTNQLSPTAHPYFADICNTLVSAHTLVRRDGAVTQYVPFHLRAWHAGQSCYEKIAHCNDYSIGIELEGCDQQAFTEAQYESLANMIAALMLRYPGITKTRITGHADISPGRKTDPGPLFDWAQLHRILQSLKLTRVSLNKNNTAQKATNK